VGVECGSRGVEKEQFGMRVYAGMNMSCGIKLLTSHVFSCEGVRDGDKIASGNVFFLSFVLCFYVWPLFHLELSNVFRVG